MILTSYNGVTFASLNMRAGIPDQAWAGPQNTAQVLSRRGYNPVHVGLDRGTKTLIADCVAKPGFNAETSLLTLLGSYDPADETERPLVGQLNDGTPVQLYAALVGYSGSTVDGVELAFSVTDPVWRELTPNVYGPNSFPYNGAAVLETPNQGKARSNLSLTLKPTAYDPGTVEFKWRRQFTLTNNSDTPLRLFPYEINLGNSNGWGNTVSGNASKTWIFRDGLPVPRELIGWSEIQSFCWILIDDLAPAATATYDICWEGIADSPGLTGNRRPGFDITWEKNNATGGSTSTIVKSSATWRTNQWARGRVDILSGTGAGQFRNIFVNTATTITIFGSNWVTPPDATSVFLLSMSHNDRWVYDVYETSRSNLNRGLWYQNKGQIKPSSVVFDTPGGWYRILTNDNNDEKNQSRTFAIDVGGGDIDYFNGLDADRTAQGWTRLQESGQADGVAFSSPIEIDGWRVDYALKNPHGMTKARFGCRESGAEDWEECFSSTTASDTLVAYPTNVDTTFTSDIRHLVASLGPVDDEEIGVDWIKDSGTWSGGGLSTFFDDSKTWTAGQWVGGRIRIISGTGQGQSRTVTASTTLSVTISPNWTTQPDDSSRYEIKNPTLVATLRHNTMWEVRLNTSKITQSAIGAQITNYSLAHVLTLGGGPDLVLPYQEVALSPSTRRVFVGSTEELRIDGGRRRAGVYLTSSGVLQRDVTNAVTVRDTVTNPVTSGTQKLLAPEWLVVPPTPSNPVGMNGDFATTTTGWSLSTATAGVTQTGTWDGTLGHLANGSLKLDITASTAAIGAAVQWTQTAVTQQPVLPGQSYTATCWVRSSSLNWVGKITLFWYNAANAFVGAQIPAAAAVSYTKAINTWTQIGVTGIPVATAVSCRILLHAYQTVANSTGTVWFDDVIWITTALFMATQSAGATLDVTATLTDGYHG